MTERVHYSKAPITEAIIDLEVTQADDFSVKDLEAIGEEIGDRYPNQEPIYLHSGQISIQEPGDPAQVETSHQHGGFSFTSQDKQQILEARMDGFTFRTRAPYDRWENFRDEAYHLWEVYRSAARVEAITRATLRYINRIDIPREAIEFEDYFRTYPHIPEEMPNDGQFGSFFMQLQLWQEDLDCMLIVNQVPALPPQEDTTSIRLDFDLFREEFAEPWDVKDDASVWSFLEKLHDLKNEAFESSITNETRRLIK